MLGTSERCGEEQPAISVNAFHSSGSHGNDKKPNSSCYYLSSTYICQALCLALYKSHLICTTLYNKCYPHFIEDKTVQSGY